MSKESIASRDVCVVRELINRNASQWPNQIALKFDSGERFSYLELKNHVITYAANLQNLGVKQGDYVLTWLPNSPSAVTLFLALNYIGAVYVPINTAYRGGVLQHVINNSQASLMIADGRLIERLQNIEVASLKNVVVLGKERPTLSGITLIDESCLSQAETKLKALQREIKPEDTHIVIFTSGTTGPSKGVMASYIHTYTTACEFRHVGSGDCNLVALPMFHIGGVLGISFALIHGGSAAMVESFRTSTFWQTVAKMQVTTVGLLGAMVQFLMQQTVQKNEKQHTIKTAVIAPLGDDALAFAERFGIEVYTEFNMTELSVPLYCGPNPRVRGTCGKPRAGVELRLIDAQENPVAVGEVGELLVRTQSPWEMSHGYLHNPQATEKAWRDGWFHTGDLFSCDEENNYFFVDRVKDMIRRRGENISSFEVEAEIIAHPDVSEVAVVAVSGDGGEDEVLAVLTAIAGTEIEPEKILSFLQPRLAHFMIPRYIRILPELPKTPTQKVEKHVLRSQGLTTDTWDREAAGIKIKRQVLSARE